VKNIYRLASIALLMMSVPVASAMDLAKIMFVPKHITSLVPYSTETLEANTCVYTTSNSEEISRLKTIMAATEPVGDRRARPWYRSAVFLYDGPKVEKYFFEVAQEDVDGAVVEKFATEGSGFFRIPRDAQDKVFAEARESAYLAAPGNAGKPGCGKFTENYEYNVRKD
jgi:hypothetical protein